MPQTTLGWYLNDASTLIHDQAYAFTSQDQLTRWVNEARRQCAQRTGCVRRTVTGQSAFGATSQPGQIIPGGLQPGALPGNVPGAVYNASTNAFGAMRNIERYPFQGFINPFLTQQHDGIEGCLDICTCAITWGGGPGGSPRPALAWLAWEDLQAYARAYATLVTSYPYYWSTYNEGSTGEFWLFPVPSQSMEMELDCFCIPKDLYSDNDYDAIPLGFSNSIKYLAASLTYMSSRRYQDAQIMENIFADRLGIARTAVDMGKTPNFYHHGV